MDETRYLDRATLVVVRHSRSFPFVLNIEGVSRWDPSRREGEMASQFQWEFIPNGSRMGCHP